MDNIFLIRHTTPAVARGICYGQTDLDITESFAEEAEAIRRHLLSGPSGIVAVYSSPLQRCSRLARHLFPEHSPTLLPQLMEVHCGEWEMRSWDELPKEEVDPWMADFVQVRIPGGESYLDLHQRVTQCWEMIRATMIANAGGTGAGYAGNAGGDVAIVAHGGVIRSILSGITGTQLIDSFKVFSLYYGCVIRVFWQGGAVQYEILYNQATAEREQHKPSSFYAKQ
jgi:alpha-ribazole phosphatase